MLKFAFKPNQHKKNSVNIRYSSVSFFGNAYLFFFTLNHAALGSKNVYWIIIDNKENWLRRCLLDIITSYSGDIRSNNIIKKTICVNIKYFNQLYD